MVCDRVIISARSAVLKFLLSKISNTRKSKLTINLDVDDHILYHFLKYLYTGSLSISANNKQFLSLAEMYQVKTLKKICQLAVHESDVVDIKYSLFALI